MALTTLAVQAAKKPGMFADGGGLYLRISASGAKSWIFRFQQNGRRRDMGLGSIRDVSLAEAREALADQRKILKRQRIDPIERRRREERAAEREAAKRVAFAEVAEQFVAAHQAGWSNAKHAYQWRQTLGTYINPVIGTKPVGEVDTPAVLEVLRPIWITKAETASRCRGRVEAILDYAKSLGLREGENPARWKGHIENLLPKRSSIAAARTVHYAALPYGEIAEFMALLRSRTGTAGAALGFAILTCARTGEVLGAKWSEIDFKGRLWTVPANRMKARKEHRVPLSEVALAILERMKQDRHGDYLFPGQSPGKPLSNMALLMLLRKMGRGDLTAHGFRSTFRDWAAEATNFPSEVCEMALAHVVGDKVEAAYRRGDLFEKRRQLSEAWATFCDASMESDNVRLLRTKQN